MSLSTVTVTLLFTDIQGSTRLWEEHPEPMRLALARHDALMREAIAAHGGHVFKTMGDAFYAAFPSAPAAAQAAVDAQERLTVEPWPTPTPLRVRMALVTGTVEARDDDYFGRAVNRVARLLGVGHGGQILVAASTHSLLSESLPLDDLGQHQLRDLSQPERLYQLRYAGCPSGFPPLKTATELLQNLPQQLTPFVGREREVLEWSRQIRERTRRLFTITGLGGVGKTRAALRIGEELIADFPDHVWWCDLEQASTVDEAVNRLALALRVTLQPTPGVREQLFRHLHDRKALLILDNLEQVAGGALLIRDLLADAPEVVCLVTSRRTLEIRGEAVLELDPMPESESLDLFCARASECRPDFALDADNRDDVLELCRRLEGVPLAIELAAARIVGMQPGQILQRLKERFRLLQSRSQELNERQRALRGAIDWSYNLLSDDDREVFAQLSVFVGGFTLEEAEAICDAFDVFESVLELRKQSLFRSTDQHFVMLDSLREYAAEKLAQTPDGGAAVKDRHAQAFLRFARARIALVRTPDEARALRELQASEGNLGAALEWAVASGQSELAAELYLIAGVDLQRHGFRRSAVERIQAGLDIVAGPALTGRLLLERAGLHYDFGEEQACVERAAEARALFEQAGDRKGLAQVENLIGKAALIQRRFAEACQGFARAQELFEQAGDRVGVAIALNNHGLALRRDQSGTPAELVERRQRAGVHLAEALRIRQAVGDQRGLAETHINLGVLAFEKGEYPDSWRHYREALTFERLLDNRSGIGVALANLGEVAGIQGDPALGARLLLAAELVLADIGSPLARDVQAMREALEPTEAWGAAQVAAARLHLRSMNPDQRCEWALSESSL